VQVLLRKLYIATAVVFEYGEEPLGQRRDRSLNDTCPQAFFEPRLASRSAASGVEGQNDTIAGLVSPSGSGVLCSGCENDTANRLADSEAHPKP
jgi:hypothetical protein